jgi:NitT/TauT family transport system permease protein
VESGRLFYHAGITVIEAFTGFALGGLAGMAVGIVLGQSRTLADILDPFIMIFTACPRSPWRRSSCCGSASAST